MTLFPNVLEQVGAAVNAALTRDIAADLGRVPDITEIDQVNVFQQWWPNTAGGYCRPGMVTGQAFRRDYTTVIMFNLNKGPQPKVGYRIMRENWYVYFGTDQLAYKIVTKGDELYTYGQMSFFRDFMSHHLVDVGQSEKYFDPTKVTSSEELIQWQQKNS